MFYLVISECMRGRLPRIEILEKYKLVQLIDIVGSIKEGNLALFMKGFNAYKSLFIKHKVFTSIEQLQLTVYRRAVKRM